MTFLLTKTDVYLPVFLIHKTKETTVPVDSKGFLFGQREGHELHFLIELYMDIKDTRSVMAAIFPNKQLAHLMTGHLRNQFISKSCAMVHRTGGRVDCSHAIVLKPYNPCIFQRRTTTMG